MLVKTGLTGRATRKFAISYRGFAVVALTAFVVLASVMAYSYGYFGGTSNTTPTPVFGPGLNQAAWTTYHGDPQRSGYDPTGVLAIHPSVNWTSVELDGEVYAEPLVVGDEVLIATENDTVYGMNATTGALLWRTHLGTPVSGSQLPCGDIDPSGITGTPVVDGSTGTLYLVAFVQPGEHLLYSLNVSNGRVLRSQLADPAGSNPLVEQQRGALALLDGRIYVPYGGLFGDCGGYHGWVVGLSAFGTNSTVTYQATQSREGGIWAPSGIVVYGGDLLVTVGNDASMSNFDYGNSVLLLSPDLQLLDWFAPSNWLALNQQDLDLGSTSPTVLGEGLLFQVGKQGVGYLLNASQLGHIGGQLYQSNLCAGAYGGTAYLYPYLYVPCSDGLYSLFIDNRTPASFTTVWHAAGDFGPPIISGNEVWAVNLSSGQLVAFDPSSGVKTYSLQLSGVVHFETPAAGDGFVFAASGDRIVAVSG